MDGKGVVSDRQRGVECDEKGGKIHKNTNQKIYKGNNLAKLNDRECPFFAHRLHKNHLENKGSEYVLLFFRP